jgi:hypothetical protein
MALELKYTTANMVKTSVSKFDRIEWDSLIVGMLILAAIIWFTVYLEHWTYRRTEKQKEQKERKKSDHFH